MVVVLAAGCGQPQRPASPPASTPVGTAAVGPAGPVDPERIKRVRGDLPPGYEVTDISGPAALSGLWGFRAGWTADPPHCAGLVDPVAAPAEIQTERGLSGSGPGGIVYVAVVAALPGTLALDPALAVDCSQFTMAYGRSTASVHLVDAPPIADAATVGMTTAISTVVESGNETDSQAQTFTAYADDHFVFVTLVTDPGSPNPPLPPEFGAGLLVKTVSALRR
ncbi:DUF5642 family protein [Mycolicibacterium komossense]|uniref:DUF5642 family protein n=2 Tax=Mycolicibacterium komossense TaxID=1779 RepID=A0ABT3CE84_9MYCO|nr:DUF5642 family protein [Mycolicibacterium komossense]